MSAVHVPVVRFSAPPGVHAIRVEPGFVPGYDPGGVGQLTPEQTAQLLGHLRTLPRQQGAAAGWPAPAAEPVLRALLLHQDEVVRLDAIAALRIPLAALAVSPRPPETRPNLLESSPWHPESWWAPLMPVLAELWPEVLTRYVAEAQAQAADVTPILYALWREQGGSPRGWPAELEPFLPWTRGAPGAPGTTAGATARPTWPHTRALVQACGRRDPGLLEQLLLASHRLALPGHHAVVVAEICTHGPPRLAHATLRDLAPVYFADVVGDPGFGDPAVRVAQESVLLALGENRVAWVAALGQALAARGAAFTEDQVWRAELQLDTFTKGRHLAAIASVPGLARASTQIWDALVRSRDVAVMRAAVAVATDEDLVSLMGHLLRKAPDEALGILDALRPDQVASLPRERMVPFLRHTRREVRLWALRLAGRTGGTPGTDSPGAAPAAPGR